jgi:hypothetical protein
LLFSYFTSRAAASVLDFFNSATSILIN